MEVGTLFLQANNMDAATLRFVNHVNPDRDHDLVTVTVRIIASGAGAQAPTPWVKSGLEWRDSCGSGTILGWTGEIPVVPGSVPVASE